MNTHNIILLAKQDTTFAMIATALNPFAKLKEIHDIQWEDMVIKFQGEKWIEYAINMRAGILKPIESYSSDPKELSELGLIRAFNNRFNNYRMMLVSKKGESLSSYLNDISIEEFMANLNGLEGNNAARKIQELYKTGKISMDLGGTQLYRFMEDLGMAYIPKVSKLNAARKGDIPKRGNLKRN